MSQRVAVVTGAAHGIGRAVAERLRRDGWTLALLDRDDAAGERAAAELQASFWRCDVGEPDEVAAAFADLRERHPRLGGLVNNAGIMVRKPLRELGLAEWQRVLAVNLTAAMLCAKHAEAPLRAGRGAIVNVASTRARMSEPDTESYAAAKGGLVALSHALAVSLGPEVRVNAVSPGWIDTAGEALAERDHAQHPAGRVGRPEDVAALVAYLLGPESGFVTGAEFVVDGGMTRKMIYLD